MPFLHPAILVAGLAAVSVPIIIHLLLRRRKKPMEWGAMRFVLEAYRKTRRRTTLERWLLLACRCLLIAAIAVGLARPLIAGRAGDSTSGRTLWLVLDDGLIGQTTRDGKTDLSRAVERCKGVLSTLGPGDRAGVILAGAPARAIVSPPSGNLAGVRAALDALTPTDTPSDWTGAIGLTAEAIASDRSGRAEATKNDDTVLLAQTARAGSARLDDPLTRLPAGTRVIAAEPDAGAPRNIAITGVRPLRPVLLTGGEGSEAAQTVTVSLRRFGEGTDKAERTQVTVRLADVAQVAPSSGTVDWTPGQRDASVTVVVDTPREAAKASATSALVIAQLETSRDAVAGDDQWRLPVVSREALRVGVLADAAARGSSFSSGTADRFRPGQWVTLALRPSESAAVDLIDLDPAALDSARLAGLDAVIVLSPEALSAPAGADAAAPSGWSRLRPFADQGGLLIVTPPFEPAAHQWAPAMATALGVPFTVGQAPREFPADAPGRIATATGNPDPTDPLSTLRGELEALARPIGVFKMSPPIETASAPPGEGREEARTLLRTQDGSPLITMLPRRVAAQGTAPSGAVIYISTAFDLRWTDLPAKPLMVPLLHELVRQGVGRARPVYASLAGAKATAPAGSVQLKTIGDAVRVLAVDQAGRTAEPVRNAGAFTAVDAQAGDRGLVAVNAAPTADTTPFAREQLAVWLAGALPEQADAAQPQAVEWANDAVWSSGLSAAGSGGGTARIGAGPLVLAAAVALVALETLLARVASANAVRQGKGGAA